MKRFQPLFGEKSYFNQVSKILQERLRESVEIRLLKTLGFFDEERAVDSPIDLFDVSFSLVSFFSLRNIRKLKSALMALESQNKEECNRLIDLVSDLIDEKIFEELEDMRTDKIFEKDCSLLEFNNFLELYNSLRYIKDKVSISDPVFIDFVEIILPNDFFCQHFKKAFLSDNFEELERIYKNWPEKNDIFKGLLFYLIEDEVIFRDYKKYENEIYLKETVKGSNFWKFLVSIGFDKQAEKIIG